MSDQNGVVIVGAGAGGDAASMALRKQGYQGPITMVGQETYRSYERPHLSKQLLLGTSNLERIFLRKEGEYEEAGINHVPERSVMDGDLSTKTVVLDDGASLRFGQLIVATGATPRSLPGVPAADNILLLRTLAQGLDLKARLDAADRVLVVGAGFIGAEVASSARTLGKDVLLVELADVPLERVLGREIGERYARMHRDHGVDLRTSTSVGDWKVENNRLISVTLSDGSDHEVDLALIAVGVTPNLTLAEKLGLDVGPQGVNVDESLRAATGVWAIGDIAAHLHPVFGRRIRVEHWQVAQRQGTAVGASIAAGEASPYTELPWFWSDQYDVNLQYVGNAAKFDRTIVRGSIDDPSFSVFYLKDRVIDATLSVNDAKSGRFSRDLISNRVAISEDLASRLADQDTDMRALVRDLAA